LRPAQDLHVVDIHEVENRAEYCREIHIIDIEGDPRRISQQEVSLADAADERLIRAPRARRCLAHRDVGCLLGDVDDVLRALLGELLARDRGDGDRCFLCDLGPELRRDHDFLQLVTCARGLALSWGGRCVADLRARY